MAANVGLSGVLTKSLSREFAATLGLTGRLTKVYFISLPASLGLTSVFVATRVAFVDLVADLPLVASLSKPVSKVLSAQLSLVGAVTKKVTQTLQGALGLLGSLEIFNPRNTAPPPPERTIKVLLGSGEANVFLEDNEIDVAVDLEEIEVWIDDNEIDAKVEGGYVPVRKVKDPYDESDYHFDWSDLSKYGDTIATSTWEVPEPLVKVRDNNTSLRTSVWVGGGDPNVEYKLINSVVTVGTGAYPRKFQRTILLRVEEL